jgi:hypothetical protein
VRGQPPVGVSTTAPAPHHPLFRGCHRPVGGVTAADRHCAAGKRSTYSSRQLTCAHASRNCRASAPRMRAPPRPWKRGVRIDVDWHGGREPLPADIDLSAFHIVQEAVTNVVRHAGTAQCQVLIHQQDDSCRSRSPTADAAAPRPGPATGSPGCAGAPRCSAGTSRPENHDLRRHADPPAGFSQLAFGG